MQMPCQDLPSLPKIKMTFFLKWVRRRAVTCVRGDRFPISSRTSWRPSATRTRCLEMFLWATEQELSSQQPPANRCGAECGAGCGEAQTLGLRVLVGRREPSRAAAGDGDGVRVLELRAVRAHGTLVTHCWGSSPGSCPWDHVRAQVCWGPSKCWRGMFRPGCPCQQRLLFQGKQNRNRKPLARARQSFSNS